MPSNRIVFAVIARRAQPAEAIHDQGIATPPAGARDDGGWDAVNTPEIIAL